MRQAVICDMPPNTQDSCLDPLVSVQHNKKSDTEKAFFQNGNLLLQ